MARIRSIKPEFWSSEQIVECTPIARLLFVGMWNFCDDGGNHPASVKTLKMEVFPGDDITQESISNMIRELIANRLIVEYEAKDKLFWHVTGWNHQKIDRPNYKHPAYPGLISERNSDIDRGSLDDDSTSPRRTLDESSDIDRGSLDDQSPPEGKGEEGKGEEENPPTPQGGESGEKTPPAEGDEIPRNVKIALLLRKSGILDAQPANPHLHDWVEASVSDKEVLGAIAIARTAKPEPEVVPLAYLAKIMPKIIADRGKKPTQSAKPFQPNSGSVPDPNYPYGNKLRPRVVA